MGSRARLVWIVALLSAASWVQAQGLFDDNEARRRIDVLRQDFQASQKTLQDRLTRMEGALTAAQDKSALVELAGMIDGLKQDIARLNGQIEVLLNRADSLDRRQKDLYVDLDTRFRRIEQAQTQLEQNQAQLQDRLAAPEREAAQEKQSYEAALNQFKVGNYQSAIAGFQGFMANFPNSQLVPSAQYWIGNSYYALRDYKVAIAAQQKVVSTWPDNPKAADAMLNIASSQQELGDAKAARETLKSLLSKYPQSAAAEQAKQRLGGASARR
jgi:tol-pal system protein YbgF